MPRAAACSLPPCGGGLGWGVVDGYGVRVQPPSLSLPRKGGGNVVAALRKKFCTSLAAVALIAIALSPAQAQRGEGPDSSIPPVEAVTAQNGMVVAQEARAARIGADVLRRGGNAVDAAVAVGFAMAVTYPRAGNIGGGGF